MEKERDKIDLKNYKQSLQNDIRSISPEKRLKDCYDKGANFQFNALNNPILRYFRSGQELIKQANVYLKEGDLEDGYILYIRCLTMYLHKIETHQEYSKITPGLRENIKNTSKEILPKTEEIKKKLLEQFKQEHLKFKQELEELERLEIERLKLEEKQRLKEKCRNAIPTTTTLNRPQIGITAGALTATDEYRLKRDVLPAKTYITPHLDEPAQSSRDRKIPSVDRSTKPTSLTSSDRLREMIIPNELMQHFLKLAFSNTSNNTETCGILAGKLERNRLLVSHVLIPKQSGSPDSCITHNEEEIFDYQDQHDLITLGWIHTHPTQTAFLSSVDLHTHCAYQLMMAEAIAIVCAPKYDETGFFHLTPDYGLNYIANCRESGFHPHPIDPALYVTAKHYKLDPMASIEAVDLRKK